MKLQNMLLLLLALIFSLAANSQKVSAQTTTSARIYQQMTQSERSEFIASQAQRIATEMSGRNYEFTPAFVEDIQQAVNQYSRRLGKNGDTSLVKRDLAIIFHRG